VAQFVHLVQLVCVLLLNPAVQGETHSRQNEHGS